MVVLQMALSAYGRKAAQVHLVLFHINNSSVADMSAWILYAEFHLRRDTLPSPNPAIQNGSLTDGSFGLWT